ncbi:MAG: M1 family metallopeptidase [Ignavibacteriae bacterium]|nr:M1 family metallopeptidase [Ignavibacteriota bacterium]
MLRGAFRYFSIIAGAFILSFTCLHAKRNDPRIFGYDVQFYELTIGFNVQAKSFGGNVMMSAEALSKLDTIVLSASNKTLTIDSIFFNGRRIHFLHENDHLYVVPTTKPTASHSFELYIFYNGVSDFHGEYEGGGVFFNTDRGVERIATSSQPHFARTWWPCKDVPDDKATMNINITVPNTLTAVSNGILKNIELGEKTNTFQWETEYPISTYLVSVAASIYRQYSETYTGLNGQKMKISYYVYPEHYFRAQKDFENTLEIVKFFATTFCEYPFINEKLGFVEVPGQITMEHQTIVSMSDNIITGDQQYELTLVHEISHHWWGNLLTPENWQHTWLNEGFATYAEGLWLEHSKGKLAYNKFIYDLMSVNQGQFAGSVIGASDTAFLDSFSPRVYRKGALVLHMLRGVVGDSNFFTIMRNYLNLQKFHYGNVNTGDFITECEQVYGKSLKWFFDEWVYAHTETIDRPEYELSWTDSLDFPNYAVNVLLKQTTARTQLYQMPMTISISTNNNIYNFKVENSLPTEMFTFTVPEKPRWVEIDRDNWIFKQVKLVEKKY